MGKGAPSSTKVDRRIEGEPIVSGGRRIQPVARLVGWEMDGDERTGSFVSRVGRLTPLEVQVDHDGEQEVISIDDPLQEPLRGILAVGALVSVVCILIMLAATDRCQTQIGGNTMDMKELVDTSPITSLVDNIGVKSVFGEPIEEDGVVIIPVAQVEYGFGYGGGYGNNPNAGEIEDGADQEAADEERTGRRWRRRWGSRRTSDTTRLHPHHIG